MCVSDDYGIIEKNSLMYVLSVCTALHFPAPTADSALTLTLYSVPVASLGTMVEVWGEPGMVSWLLQEVVPFILYWRKYREMGSSLCGVVQVACKAGNLDNTALDRDSPVTWEGTLTAFEVNRTQYMRCIYLYTISSIVYSILYNIMELHTQCIYTLLSYVCYAHLTYRIWSLLMWTVYYVYICL